MSLLRIIFTSEGTTSRSYSSPSSPSSSSKKRQRVESSAQTRSATRSTNENGYMPTYVNENTTIFLKSPTMKHKINHNRLQKVHDHEINQVKVNSVRDGPTRGLTAIAATTVVEARPIDGHRYFTLEEAESYNKQNITILGVSIGDLKMNLMCFPLFVS